MKFYMQDKPGLSSVEKKLKKKIYGLIFFTVISLLINRIYSIGIAIF